MNALIVLQRRLAMTLMVAAVAAVGFVFVVLSGDEEIDAEERAEEEDDEARFMEWVEEYYSDLHVDVDDALLIVDVKSDGVYVDGRQVETFIDARDAYENAEGARPETWTNFTTFRGVRGEPLERLSAELDGVVQNLREERNFESIPTSVHIRSDGWVDAFWFDRLLITLTEAGFRHATVEMPDWFVAAAKSTVNGEIDSYVLRLIPALDYLFCGWALSMEVPKIEGSSGDAYPTEHWLETRGLVEGEVHEDDPWSEFDVSDPQLVQKALQVAWEEDVLRSMGITTEESFSRGDADVFRIAFDMPMWLVWGVAMKYQDAFEQSFSDFSGDSLDFHNLVYGNNYFVGRPSVPVARAQVHRSRSFDEFLALAESYRDAVND